MSQEMVTSMKRLHKALLFTSLPAFIAFTVTPWLIFSGEHPQAMGFGLGALVVILFSVTWIISVDRISSSNMMKFLKVFSLLFAGKLVVLLMVLGLSVSVLNSDRIYFTLSFCIMTLFTLPVEIWFGLTRGKNNA